MLGVKKTVFEKKMTKVEYSFSLVILNFREEKKGGKALTKCFFWKILAFQNCLFAVCLIQEPKKKIGVKLEFDVFSGTQTLLSPFLYKFIAF